MDAEMLSDKEIEKELRGV